MSGKGEITRLPRRLPPLWASLETQVGEGPVSLPGTTPVMVPVLVASLLGNPPGGGGELNYAEVPGILNP